MREETAMAADRPITSDRLEPEALREKFHRARAQTLALVGPLNPEDTLPQPVLEVSPPKWHLAHTTWFFEHFLLKPFQTPYRPFGERFDYLFNSYYKRVGTHLPRDRRGFISRPSLEEILNYRRWVENKIEALFPPCESTRWEEAAPRLELGIHHEQQHQELLLMDIKYIFSINPLRPCYRKSGPHRPAAPDSTLQWVPFPGGLHEIGWTGSGFAFDNEGPRHRVFLEPYRLTSRLVSQGEYLNFMLQGGYQRPELWLSEGWDLVTTMGWEAPLYWEKKNGTWWQFTLSGMVPVRKDQPVHHVSFYEADAFARWAGNRLPTEAEWELAAQEFPLEGNFLETGALQPRETSKAPGPHELQQLFGDVWEWTASPYVPYPRFRPLPGALGEYNGKFMCNQMVLRGGSCLTPRDHVRPSYRNFYPPQSRWAMSGFRLAEDL